MIKFFLITILFAALSYVGWHFLSSNDSINLASGYYTGQISNERGQIQYRIIVVSDGRKSSFFFSDLNSKLSHEVELLKGHRLEFNTAKGRLKFKSEQDMLRGTASLDDSEELLKWELKTVGAGASSLEISEENIAQKIRLLDEFNQQKVRLELLNDKIKNQTSQNSELEGIIAEPDKLKTLMEEKRELAEVSVAELKNQIHSLKEELEGILQSQQRAARLSARGSLAIAVREALELEGQAYQKMQNAPVFAMNNHQGDEAGDATELRSKILAEKDAIYLLRYKLKIPQTDQEEQEGHL